MFEDMQKNIGIKLLMNLKMVPGWVYILSNVSMPGMFKIGYTTRDPKGRVAELSTTGVPTPFILEYYAKVGNAKATEIAVHSKLSKYRVATNREFFTCDLASAVATIQDLSAGGLIQELYKEGIKRKQFDDQVAEEKRKIEEENELELKRKRQRQAEKNKANARKILREEKQLELARKTNWLNYKSNLAIPTTSEEDEFFQKNKWRIRQKITTNAQFYKPLNARSRNRLKIYIKAKTGLRQPMTYAQWDEFYSSGFDIEYVDFFKKEDFFQAGMLVLKIVGFLVVAYFILG